MVNYLEREAAEGSEADPSSNNRPTSVTPTTDPRFIRSVSMTRSESGDFYNNSGGKSRQTASPLIPLEQLLQQDQVSGNLILIYTFYGRTSLFVHKVAQPTNYRFFPKNLSQPLIFMIGLAFT